MTKLVVNSGTTPKQLTFGDLKPGDWFICNDKQMRIKHDEGYLNVADGTHWEGSYNVPITKLSKVTITYELEE